MSADMSKRKRENNEGDSVDVGLGATLAHLRGETQPNATSTAVEDDEGWTVAGGSKRRRKERTNSNSSRENRRGSAAGAQDAHSSDARAAANPFVSNGEKLGDEKSTPENPFSASKGTPERASEETTLTREERRKERKLERNYPSIEHSHHARLQSHVKITDLQALVLYLLADGNAPQWVSVRNRTGIRQVVMLMVPGLELGMFNGKVPLDAATAMDIDTAADQVPADAASISQEVTPSEKITSNYLRIADNDFILRD
jgi:RNA exonuclease 1